MVGAPTVCSSSEWVSTVSHSRIRQELSNSIVWIAVLCMSGCGEIKWAWVDAVGLVFVRNSQCFLWAVILTSPVRVPREAYQEVSSPSLRSKLVIETNFAFARSRLRQVGCKFAQRPHFGRWGYLRSSMENFAFEPIELENVRKVPKCRQPCVNLSHNTHIHVM